MRRFFFIAFTLVAIAPVSPASAQDIGDPWQLVAHWYQAYLGRNPDRDGIRSWVDALRRGQSPDSVLSGILGSDEYYQRAGSRPDTFVLSLYRDLLGRSPSQGELNFWVRRQYTDTHQEVVQQILTQNAGAWVGTYRLSPRDRDRWYRDRDHERERADLLKRLRDLERDRHDYRRPPLPYPYPR